MHLKILQVYTQDHSEMTPEFTVGVHKGRASTASQQLSLRRHKNPY